MFWRKKKKSSETTDDPQDLVAQKEYKKAIDIYRERLTQDRENVNLRLQLADALLYYNQLPDALKEYKKVATSYANQGFMVKAIAIYKKMLKLNPGWKEIESLLENLSERLAIDTEIAQTVPPPEEKPPVAGSLELETTLFKDLTREEFKQIVANLTLRHYDEETIVVKEGDPGTSLFIIVQGQVRVLTRDPKQREVILATLSEGEFFGEISLLTGKPRTATIITNTSSDLLELSRDDFAKIVKKHPRVQKVVEEFHLQRANKTVEAIIQSLQKP